MGNGPRRRRRQQGRPDPTLMRVAAKISAAVRGCVCEPDLHLVHQPDGWHQRIAHDAWCPAADTGPAYVIVPRSERAR